ncbi:MAG: PP2C family protein-serine/threonine phosphatase [Oceanococcus sp.]
MTNPLLPTLQKRLFQQQPRCGFAQWAVRMQAAEHVTGDVHGIWGDANGKKMEGFFGDVMGHGADAAFVAVALQAHFAQQLRSSLAERLESVNRFLYVDDVDSMYCTGIAYTLHENGLLHVLNAGHSNAILLRKNGEVHSIPKNHSAPLGLFDELNPPEEEHIQLCSRDRVLFLSDGLLERAGKKTKTKLLPDEVRFELIKAACTGSLKQDADIIWDLLVGINAPHQKIPDDQSLLLLELL